MRNITINNEENQSENQKTTPVTESLFEPNNSRLSLHCLFLAVFYKLGWVGGIRTPEYQD